MITALPTDINLYSVVIFTFLVSVSSLVLVLIYLSYLFIADYFQKRKRMRSSPEKEAYSEALSVIDTARKDSLVIVRRANEKAQEILRDSHNLHDYVYSTLEKRLSIIAKSQSGHFKELSYSVMNKYRLAMKEESEKALEGFRFSLRDINKEMLVEIDNFVQSIRADVSETAEITRARVKDKTQEVEKEVIAYKDRRISQVSDEIRSLVKDAAEEVLHKNMTIGDHEDLIMTSLEKIKNSPKFRNI